MSVEMWTEGGMACKGPKLVLKRALLSLGPR